MVQIQNGILLSHKRKQIWVSCREVDEPSIIQSEESKTEKENHVLMHIYGVYKNGTDGPVYREGVEMQT